MIEYNSLILILVLLFSHLNHDIIFGITSTILLNYIYYNYCSNSYNLLNFFEIDSSS